MEKRPRQKGNITDFRDIRGSRDFNTGNREFSSFENRRNRNPAARQAPASSRGSTANRKPTTSRGSTAGREPTAGRRSTTGREPTTGRGSTTGWAPTANREPMDNRAQRNPRSRRGAPIEAKRAYAGNGRQGGPGQPRENQRRPRGRQPKKRRIPLQLRRFLIVFTLFCALLATAFIGIFLVFKVDTVELTGDQLYSVEDVMKACDYHYEDNLFFLSTTDKEQLLPEKLPYIGKAKISRKIPGTIVIELTAAVPASQFQMGDNYVLVDETGKVLDMKDEATEGVMLITGTEPGEQSYGKSFTMADEEKLTAYQQILTKLSEENAVGDITKLDITDAHDITMLYQNRITMKLGGAADIPQKVRLGLNIARESIPSNKRGVMDLTLVSELGEGYFKPETGQSSIDESAGSQNGDSGEQTYNFASNPGRGSDIPDTPYTGGSNDTENTPQDGTNTDE